MTPQEFVETLEPPEVFRRVAVVTALPLYSVTQWMAAVRQHAGIKFDRYAFRINPIRLQGFIDGVDEPRLAMTVYDGLAPLEEKLAGVDRNGLIIVQDLVL